MALVRMKPPVGVSVGLGADDKLYYIDGQGFANVDSGSVTKLTGEGWASAVPVAPEAPGNNFPVSASKTLTGVIEISDGMASFSETPSRAVPAHVSGVVAFAGDTQAMVCWDLLDPYSSYIVKSGGVIVGTAVAGSTSVLVSGLTNGVLKQFTVVASNSNGDGLESVASNSVTPGAGPVAGLPPMSIWLDAEHLALANGASVTAWSDRSGNGHDAVNSGTGLTTYTAPTFATPWANAKPSVALSGNNQALTLKGLKDALRSKNTVFIVGDCTSLTNSGAQANQQLLTNQRYVAAPKWDDQAGVSINTASGTFNADSGGGLRASSTAITLSAATLLSLTLPGNLYVNGTKRSNLVSGIGKSNANNLVLGSNVNNGTLAFAGHVAEVIIYPVELTQAQRWVVEAYLATKYGLTVAQQ